MGLAGQGEQETFGVDRPAQVEDEILDGVGQIVQPDDPTPAAVLFQRSGVDGGPQPPERHLAACWSAIPVQPLQRNMVSPAPDEQHDERGPATPDKNPRKSAHVAVLACCSDSGDEVARWHWSSAEQIVRRPSLPKRPTPSRKASSPLPAAAPGCSGSASASHLRTGRPGGICRQDHAGRAPASPQACSAKPNSEATCTGSRGAVTPLPGDRKAKPLVECMPFLIATKAT